jgi:lysophospholipase L1-like esterase
VNPAPALLMKPDRQRIICLGDSLTLGLPDPELDKWAAQLALHLEKKWPATYDVYNRGYNGATTHDVLNKIESEVGYLLPAIVLVALGVNDALVRSFRRMPQVGVGDFQNNLADINHFVTAKGGKTVFVIEHVPDDDARPEGKKFSLGNGKPYRENYAPYQQAVIEKGRELNVPVIDLPALMKAEGIATAEMVMEDGLHLTSAGHAIYARLIFGRLNDILPTLAPPRMDRAVGGDAVV